MLNAPSIPLDRLRRAIVAKYPDATLTVEVWDGGITATIAGIPELSENEGRIGIAEGSGVDPGRVLLSRMIAKHLMREEDVEAITDEPEVIIAQPEGEVVSDLRNDASSEAESLGEAPPGWAWIADRDWPEHEPVGMTIDDYHDLGLCPECEADLTAGQKHAKDCSIFLRFEGHRRTEFEDYLKRREVEDGGTHSRTTGIAHND